MTCWQIPKPGAGLLPAALLAIALALPMALTGCDEKSVVETEESPVIRPVRAITVQPVTFSLSGSVTGTIEARAEADLGFRIAGKLIERKVDVGDRVRAGDVLARLDDQDQRNALRTSEADLAAANAEQVQANNEEARKRELLSKDVVTQTIYDAALLSKRTADAKVVAAQAALQTSRDRVGYTELAADRDGVVTATGPDPGQVVEVGEMVVRVAQPEEREAVFNVAEAGIRAAPKEPVVEVALAGAPDITAMGRVREVSPQADPVTRTHTVRIALENPPDALRLGATVTGRLRQPPAPVIELPGTAMVQEDERNFVWVADPKDQTVKRRAVSIRPGQNVGGQNNGQVVITDGLAQGDIVVTAGVHSLAEGQRVRLAKQIETAAAQ